MDPLKRLAGQTAIYGLSSIVGRFLNYLLTPLWTSYFVPEQYGIITEMYAYVAFLVVLLTYGMEIAYFRFVSKGEWPKARIFSTGLYSLITTSGLFIAAATIFSQPIAEFLYYPEHREYVIWFAFIVGLDAVSTLPLARLREENKAGRFALVNLLNITVNIGLNLFFIYYLMGKHQAGESNYLTRHLFNPDIGVGYVFIANLAASAIKFLFLTPLMAKARVMPDTRALKGMLVYASPLLIAGLAGIVNETLDRAMLKWLLIGDMKKEAVMHEVGVYGACYKLSMIITIFIQAYRYAAEPFFFSEEKTQNARYTYARALTFFVVIVSAMFLFVLLYLDIFKHFISREAYWEGLHVVPILLLANIFLGIYFNLSVWYKLTEKTQFGAYITSLGALITIVLNLLLIPTMGYLGSAWATLACYFTMAVVSFAFSKKYYPIPYHTGRVLAYLGFALGLYGVSEILSLQDPSLKYPVHTLLLFLFVGIAYFAERKREKAITPV